ncbi:MAG: efflux RND transporter periplasmic adaptor subunit, partial [Planctomycetota bacterium]
MRNTRRLLILAASALLITAAPAAAQAPVRTATVRVEAVQQRQAVTGSLRAVARGDVAALEEGRLTELTVREGQPVAAGQVIARVDARRLQAAKREAQASRRVALAGVKRAKATAFRTRADLERARPLLSSGAITDQEFDTLQADYRIALAEIESTQQSVSQIEESIRLIDVRLDDTTIEAPYDATVVARHVEPGDWVRPGDALLTLVSTGPIEAWLEVPERFAEAVDRFGDSAVVRTHAAGLSGKVLATRRVADVNRRVRTMNLVVTLDNPTGLLTPGMSVDAWLAVGENAEQLTVPKDAIVRRNGRPYVFAIAEGTSETTAEQTAVQV